MSLPYENDQPVLHEIVQGSEVTIRFTDGPQPHVKENIMEILTSCYESRLQKK